MDTFLTDVINVLQEKGYNRRCSPLDALSKTVEANSKIATKKVFCYKWAGIFLLTSIPLVSALLSVAVGLENSATTQLERTIVCLRFPFSLVLTVVTILNSIFRPAERFRNACLILIRINSFKGDFLMAIRRLKKVEEHTLLDLAHKKRKEFEQFQKELIEMFMPMEISVQSER